MAKDGFYDKGTKQFPNDGGRLCALMEISPLQVVAMDIKRWVQKLLTLKTSHYGFGEILFCFVFFFPYMQFAHCRWISQFGEISPKNKTLMT